MVNVNMTRKEFFDEIMEEIDRVLALGSVILRGEHAEKIEDTLSSILEDADWNIQAFGDEGFENEIRDLIYSGALPGIFEDNLGSRFLVNSREEATEIVLKEKVDPIEASLILMARNLDGDITGAITSKVEEIVGSGDYFKVDPYEEIEFED